MSLGSDGENPEREPPGPFVENVNVVPLGKPPEEEVNPPGKPPPKLPPEAPGGGAPPPLSPSSPN